MRYFKQISCTALLILAALAITRSHAQDKSPTPTNNNPNKTNSSSVPSRDSSLTSPEASIEKPKVAPQIMKPNDLKWGTPLKNTPAMVEMAVLQGDPSKPGPFIIRVRLPKNFQMQPHYASIDQYITVLTGNLNMGMGDKFDKNSAIPLAKDTFVVMPASLHHYLWSEEGATVQVSGNGPLELNYVNPQDHPNTMKAPQTARRN